MSEFLDRPVERFRTNGKNLSTWGKFVKSFEICMKIVFTQASTLGHDP